MKQQFASAIQVQLAWATHHAWKPGQTLQSAVSTPTLWLMIEGEVALSDGRNQWNLCAGEAFLWASRALERRIQTRGGAQWLSLGLRVHFFDHLELGGALDLPVGWRPAPAEWRSLTRCARELVQCWHGGEIVRVDADSLAFYSQKMEATRAVRAPLDAMIAPSLARAVFGMCWKHLSHSEAALLTRGRVPAWIAATLRRIEDDPSVGVAALAREAGFSPAQFRRSFGEHIGVAPRTYLINHRLEVARRLLEQSDLPVGTIAAQCGFSSSSHFIHLFKRSVGLAPLQYRQSSKATPV